MEYAIHPMETEDYDSVIALWSKTDGIVLTESEDVRHLVFTGR